MIASEVLPEFVVTDLIVPICLPILKEFRTKDFTGYSPYITGWGATQHSEFRSLLIKNSYVYYVYLKNSYLKNLLKLYSALHLGLCDRNTIYCLLPIFSF